MILYINKNPDGIKSQTQTILSNKILTLSKILVRRKLSKVILELEYESLQLNPIPHDFINIPPSQRKYFLFYLTLVASPFGLSKLWHFVFLEKLPFTEYKYDLADENGTIQI